jgi:hypothetical protein
MDVCWCFLQGLFSGFIFEPLVVVMKDLDRDFMWIVRECSNLLGVLFYALASFKWQLPHKQVVWVVTTLLLVTTPFLSSSLPLLVICFAGMVSMCVGVYAVAVNMLYCSFLPIRSIDHIGFTWLYGVVWQVTFGVARFAGLAFVEQGYSLLLWGIIGGLCTLASAVPITTACRVQKPMKDFVTASPSTKSTSAISAGLVFCMFCSDLGRFV